MDENDKNLDSELGMEIDLNATYHYYSTSFFYGDVFERKALYKKYKVEDITDEVTKKFPEDVEYYFHGFCELFYKIREHGTPQPERTWMDQYASAVACTEVKAENPNLPEGYAFHDFEVKVFGKVCPDDIIYYPQSRRIIRLKDITLDELEKLYPRTSAVTLPDENDKNLGFELAMVIGLNFTYLYYSTSFFVGDVFEREALYKKYKVEDITDEVTKKFPEDVEHYFHGFCKLFYKIRERGTPQPERTWMDQYASAVACTEVENNNPDLPEGYAFQDFEVKVFGKVLPDDIIYYPRSRRIIRLKDITLDELVELPVFH
jgi:hypothetical protein